MAKAKLKPLNFKVTRTQRNVFKISCLAGNYPKGFEQWFLLTSDRHWDNPHSNWELQKEHLDEAVQRGAGILDVGDFLCLMQGRADPRSSKADLRPEHQVDNYIDTVISTAADFFAPYSKHFISIARGNHESKILKHLEVDVIERLCSVLNDRTGSSIYNGGYAGFVRFVLNEKKTGRNLGKSLVLHYSHGTGMGGGGTTRGIGTTAKKAQYLPDANIVISGHIHESWRIDLARQRLSTQNKTYIDEQTHVLIPTYKEEFGDGSVGWHSERGAPPKPIGAYWLRIYVPRVFKGDNKHLLYQIIRAK